MTPDEWIRIVSRINQERGACLHVWFFDRALFRYILHDIEQSEEMNANLFQHLDCTFKLCPFLRFGLEEAKLSCDIHDINPGTCKKYLCAGSPRFGSEIEYCEACWIDDKDHKNRKQTQRNREKPCEMGQGCKDFLHRVRFFIAYARQHPAGASINDHSPYLHNLIQKNIALFEVELAARGMADTEIKRNIEPYMELDDVLASLDMGSIFKYASNE